jgi:hypothetical protein
VADWIKNYGSTLAIVAAVIGWFVTSRQANDREKRKEFRAEIDAIEKVVEVLCEKLSSYYRSRERNDEAKLLELAIKALFKSLDLRVERLVKRQTGGTRGLFIFTLVE